MLKTIALILSITACLEAYNQEMYTIGSLPFNTTRFDEFGPVVTNSGLVFCSNRMHPFILNFKDSLKVRNCNIYRTVITDSIKYSIPKILSRQLTTAFNEGPVCFSINGDVMYLTMNIPGHNDGENESINNHNTIGLFISSFDGKKWTNPLPFVYNSDKYNTGHPFLCNDDHTMFFVSDMPGGYGGTDIYRTDLINGEWSEPVNLGSNINSSGMDLFPFYHPSGRLYFSSSRAGGVGGFDIYYSGKTNEGWHPAVVAAEPLNSMYNDFSFCCDETQESGFFASNREGSDDIFSFRLNWPIFDQCDSLKKNNYCFTFFETGNYNLDTMPLRYEWDIAGLEKISGLEADYCFEGQGNYLIKLNIIDTLTGDIFYNQATYDFKIRDIEQVYIDAPDSCIPGTPVHMDGSKTSLPGFLPGNYYWDFGDGNKAMGASVGHVYDEEGSYTITLGVRSLPDEDHISRTACVIKTIYVRPNLQYADNHDHTEIKTPADSVNPTTHEKPDLKQYGEEDIIEDKVYKVEVAKSADPIPIEDQYFDALRDLYTIMESYLSGDSVYSYTVGNETNIMNTYMIYQKVKKLGYDDALVKSFDIVPESLTVSDTLAKVLLNNLLGQWQIILFDYNEYSISPESYDMLDKVYNVLNKYQSLIIEIAAHTDDIGTDEYNRELSEKRAISVTEYLVSKGISHERLIPKGYGKSKPLTKGTSEANRAKNRRVEFIVVKTGFE